MLHYLRIENLALMDAASVEFGGGFTAVTGETGAGKSVLLGALSMLAGNRVDRTAIRQGAQQCVVEAQLTLKQPQEVNALLEAAGLPVCEEGSLVLRRSLGREKPGRVTINGALATLTTLQELGGHWVDFHGPGEPQKLFHQGNQLAMLDLFARNEELLGRYRARYGEWTGVLRQMEQVRSAERLSEEEADFLRTQIAAMNAVELDDASIDALERDFKRLDKARELADLAGALSSGLSGHANSAAERISMLLKSARELASLDPEADPLLARLDALVIESEDLAQEYAGIAESVDFDEQTAADLQDRMHRWLQLRRKYGPAAENVRAKRDALTHRLESQSNVEATLARLESQAKMKEQELRRLAEELRLARQKHAASLAAQVRKLLGKLGFAQAGFGIEVITEKELRPHGHSSCQFLFAPNAGQDALPLNKIASSGETARVMLALKAVLAQMDATPLLVFDEVDANVGGEIGAQVGKELAALAGAHQVLCVTHLPQVAARARQHFVVTKTQDDKQTRVSIARIDTDGKKRQAELARMLGDRNSASALEHASQLLAAVD